MRQSNVNCKNSKTVGFCILLATISLILFKWNVANQSQIDCDNWLQKAQLYQSCLYEGFDVMKEENIWFHLHKITAKCQRKGILPVNYSLLQNADDFKGFIDYVDEHERHSCNLITLGIGNDIMAELKFLQKVPKCRMFGADPIFESGKIFKKIGQFYNVAVSGESGEKIASVLENFFYWPKRVNHISFVDFVLNYVKITTVDHLFLDAEGAEYDILPHLKVGGKVELAGISICQLSLELHGPVANYGMNMTEWDDFIRNSFLNSNFIPLWIPPPQTHHRMFLIDWKNPICIRKFYRNHC